MDGQTDDQHETIISRHYCVAGYKNEGIIFEDIYGIFTLMLGKHFSRKHFELLFIFFQKTGFDISCKLSNLHEMSKPTF